MSAEGFGDMEPEQPHRPDDPQRLDGGYAAPDAEDDAGWQGDMLPEEDYADTGNGGLDDEELTTEPPASTFGVQRFEGVSVSFEDRPPDDYLAATSGRFMDILNGPGSYFPTVEQGADVEEERNRTSSLRGLFIDHHNVVVANPNSDFISISKVYVDLEYITHEGRALVELQPGQAALRFFDSDNQQQSYVRYLPQEEQDTLDDPAYMTVYKSHDESQGLVSFDALSLTEMPGVEEAGYSFDEVMANAQPVERTFNDLFNAVMAQIAEPGQHTELRDARSAGSLFTRLLDAYRAAYMTPERIMDNQLDTTVSYPDPDSNGRDTVTNRTGARPGLPGTTPRATASVSRAEPLDVQEVARIFAQHGMQAPEGMPGGNYINVIEITRQDGGLLDCRYTTALELPQNFVVLLNQRRFTPGVKIVQLLRNYMWADVAKGRASEV